MGTKNNPGLHDCYAAAEPDEPMFVLLARDIQAPHIVDQWADGRAGLIRLGLKPQSDQALVDEARTLTTQMRHWRKNHRLWRTIEADEAIKEAAKQIEALRNAASYDDSDGSERAANAYGSALNIIKQLIKTKG